MGCWRRNFAPAIRRLRSSFHSKASASVMLPRIFLAQVRMSSGSLAGGCGFILPRSSQLNNLVQASAYLRKQNIRQGFQRVYFRLPQPPIEGFWLVAENIAGFPWLAARCRPDGDSKWVIDVAFSASHRQPNHQRSLLVEDARRKHQERKNVPHFLPDLRVTVDPDDVLAIRHPRFALPCAYHRSAPVVWVVTITSPP